MKLRIEKAIYGGASLARVPADAPSDGPTELAGKAVFVPCALPGELVEATIANDRRSYITARLDSVLEPAPSRITPGCEYYGRCGGCHYQHADYPAQLAMKRSHPAREPRACARRDSIRTFAFSLPTPGTTATASAFTSAHLPQPALGYREAASHRDLPVTHCPSQRPSFNKPSLPSISYCRSKPALAHDLSEIEFFTTAEESALLVSLFTESANATERSAPFGRRCAPAGLCPHSQACATFSARSQNTPHATRPPHGVSHRSSMRSAPLSYQVSAGAFFQVNRYLVPTLLEEVVARTRVCASPGISTPASDSSPRHSRSASNASSPSSPPPRPWPISPAISKAPTTSALQRTRFASSSRRHAQRPDLVVVDPPRAGLGPEVCQRLAAAQPRQIVYVSCDPSTLARDLRTLQPSGYRPVALTLIDLFPQTFHLETVATLERI